jgi:gliding motility-associated-like protein
MKRICPNLLKGRSIYFGFFAFLLTVLCTHTAKSQVINEGFEENAWSTGFPSSTSGSIVITATSASSTMSYMSIQGQSSFSTAVNTVPNKGTWYYSRANSSSATKLDKAHSKIMSVRMNGGGYIITPSTPAAVVSVTFWASADTKLTVGINTDTNAGGQPAYSSGNPVPADYGYATQTFSSVGNTSMTSYSYTGTFSGPCRIGFFNSGSGTVYIDDIIISGPTGTAPTVSTNSVTAGINTASVNSTVSLGLPAPSMPLHSSGVIWGTTNTIDYNSPDKTVNQPALTGSYPSTITGLTPGGVHYYTRAYVKALDGNVYYGAVLDFFTKNPVKPTLTTTPIPAPNIFANRAYSGGENIDSGGIAIAQKGICWAVAPATPLARASSTMTNNGSNGNNYSSVAKVLLPSTTYNVRAYAINAVDTGYGNIVTIITSAAVPAINAVPNLVNFGNVNYGSTSPVTSYTLSASNLNPAAGSLTITAPAGSPYKISTSASGPFTSSIPNLVYAGSSLANTKIYVQMATTSYGSFNGSYILHTGGGTAVPYQDTVFLNGNVIQDPNVATNSGTDFWLGFGYQSNMETDPKDGDAAKLSVYIAATEQAATVVVDMPYMPGVSAAPWNFPRTITIPANTVVEVKDFPSGDPNDATNAAGMPDSRLFSTGISNKGIHIYSTNGAPIATWMYTYTANNSAAGAMVFPTNTWNSSYTVQSYGGTSNSGEPASFFFVIAKDDQTVVSFTPTQPIVSSIFNSNATTPATTVYAAGVTHQVTLNKGQIFNAMGGYNPNGNSLDLSGTVVKALDCNKKIAVFGGNGRVLVSTSTGIIDKGSDNLIQQMFPKVAWGTKYLTVPTKSMEFNVYRIYVQDGSTVVKVNGSILPKTPAAPNVTPSWNATGLYYNIEGNQPNLIEADKPINVTQFIIAGSAPDGSSSNHPTIGNNGNGDPEMIILSPVQQSINKATVYSSTFKNGGSGGHYINVVIKNEGVPSFKLDPTTNISNVADTGSSSFGNSVYGSSGTVTMLNAFKQHPRDAAYSYAKFKVAGGATHNISSDYPFNAIAYGMDQGESYGYNAGTAIKNLSAINVAQNPYGTDTSTTAVRTCKNNPVRLQIALPYDTLLVDSIRWNTGIDPLITPNGITRGSLDANPLNTLDSFAHHTGTIVVDGRTYYVYQSPPLYSFAQDGTYNLSAIAYGTFVNECGSSTTHNIQVIVGHDDIVFTALPGSCGSTSVTFNNTSTPLAGTTIQQYNWNFGDGVTYSGNASTPNPAPNPHVYPALSTGVTSYWAKLETRNSVGCSNIDSVFIDLSFNLKAKFQASADTICAEGQVVFTDQSSTNTTELTWNWGDGSPNTVITGSSPTAPISHTFNTAGTYNVKLFVKNAAGCTSVVVDTNIVVIAKPVVDFQTPPGICLGGSMQFTNLTTPTTGVTYAWNFNDPNATGGNPNTSTVQSPTHIYTSTGPFNVSLVVTDTHYGCSATKTKALSSTIYALPTAAISAPSSACLKDSVPFTDASTAGTGNTLASWAWNFGETSSGVNNTSTLQHPKHAYNTINNPITVTLTVTNDKGCVSSPATVQINIKPIPNVVFNAIPNICQNIASMPITQASETTGIAGASPSWVYTGTAVTGSNFSPSTAGAGTFPIIATYNAANGCKHADTTDVTVMPLPTVAFTVAAVTCEKSSISFTDNSTPNSSSIQSWGWNFGDASANASSQNTAHTYAPANSYVVTLTVTNSNNCTASLPKTVVVHSRPLASFTMPASVCLPDGNAAFTNQSTVADDANPSYNWNFGDPNNATGSTIKDPTHQYSSVGPFTVQLTVTSQFGCIKDTTHQLSTVHPEPVAAFTALPKEVCLGDDIAFTGQSTNAISWNWDFGDNQTANVQSIPHNYTSDGTYNVAYYYTDGFGCKSNTAIATVKVNPYPVMDAGPTQYVLQGYGVELKATAQGNNLKFLWTPNTFLNYDTLLNPICKPTADQFYTLKVTNSGGCYIEDTMTVKLLKEPEIPNAFSPNGDNINDKWVIGELTYYFGCTVEVFNRGGQKLFNSVGYQNAWDGTHNGKPLPVGTYYYIINPKNGHPVIAGHVTILR